MRAALVLLALLTGCDNGQRFQAFPARPHKDGERIWIIDTTKGRASICYAAEFAVCTPWASAGGGGS